MREKYFTLVIIFLLNLFSCSSDSDLRKKDFTDTWNDWGGHPESPNQKPFDYYYMKYRGRASEISIKKKSGELMKQTCINSALEGQKDISGRMVWETVSIYSCDEDMTAKYLWRHYFQGTKVNTKECKPMAVPTPSIPLSEYRECECILYIHIPGGREYVVNLRKKVDAEF